MKEKYEFEAVIEPVKDKGVGDMIHVVITPL